MKSKNSFSSITPKIAGLLLALSSPAFAQVKDLPGGPALWQLNMPPAATKIMAEMHWLHWMMLIICTVIFVVVFGVMFYSILKHRKSVGHKPEELPEPLWVELGWTIIPFFIVIGMALPATKTLVAQKDTTNADLTIKVTGYQWKWGYDYLKGEGEGIGFLSTLDNNQRIMSNEGGPKEPVQDYLYKVDNPLVVPAGKKVRIITTAQDVIHSWWVPRFGVKIDAIPGFVRDNWFKVEEPGTYYGSCAELCGKEHAYMPVQVVALSAADYTAWVAEQQKKMAAKADDPAKVWTMDDAMVRGAKVYAANCAACHQPTGKGAGAIKPLDGSALLMGDKATPIQTVLNGAANGAMPAWKALSDTDLATVLTYARNSWTNKAGDVVQPSDVAAGRK